MTLESYLKELKDDEETPLRHSELLQFSGLSPEEMADFKTAWLLLTQDRKCDVLTRLAELGEDNLELDFTAVFRDCLADEHDEVRERATRGLWECDDRVVIRPLIALLSDDPAPNVRAAAAVSLGRFADMAQDGKLLERDSNKVRGALLSAINNDAEEEEVRRRAIESVASFNSAEVEAIIREAYSSPDPNLKRASIYAMGRSSSSHWLPLVLDEMQHEDPIMRYEAAIACGQLGEESTVPHLIGLIKDEEFQVQISAVQALGAIGGALAKRALLQCLKLEDEALEQAAQAALQNIEFDEDPLGYRFEA